MRRLIPILLLLFVAGCVGTTGPASVLIACEGFNSALRTANTFYPQMSEEQRLTVDNLIATTSPTCDAPQPPEDAATLAAVRDALRELARVNAQMEAGS